MLFCPHGWTIRRSISIATFHKVVKRLSVNRLPVKLQITGFNFQLPITDLPTFFFTLCNFRLQLRLTHATKTGLIGTRHTVAVRRLGPVGSC